MSSQQGTVTYPLDWHLALSHQGRTGTKEQGRILALPSQGKWGRVVALKANIQRVAFLPPEPWQKQRVLEQQRSGHFCMNFPHSILGCP